MPAFSPLTHEAMDQAVTADFEGVAIRVVRADHLAVIALSVGRAKDLTRILAPQQAGRDPYRFAREGQRIVLPATIGGTLAEPTASVDVAAAALIRAIHKRLVDGVRGDAAAPGEYRRLHDFKRLFTISEYYDRDRSTFYRAIQSVRERGMDLTGWLDFFTEGLATQLDEVKARGERTILRDILAREHGLSDRQSLALGHVLEHGRLTIHEYQALRPGVNRWTLQRDLSAMIEKGLLATEGQTSSLQYIVGRRLR